MIEDPVLLLTRSVVQLVKAQQAANDAAERRAAAQEQEMAAMRADHQRAMADIADAIRTLPPAVVTVTAPDPIVIPAAEVTVEAARALPPTVQDIRIVSLPPMKARVKRDPAGRIDTITEG